MNILPTLLDAQAQGWVTAGCYYFCLRITSRVSILTTARRLQILENLPKLPIRGGPGTDLRTCENSLPTLKPFSRVCWPASPGSSFLGLCGFLWVPLQPRLENSRKEACDGSSQNPARQRVCWAQSPPRLPSWSHVQNHFCSQDLGPGDGMGRV